MSQQKNQNPEQKFQNQGERRPGEGHGQNQAHDQNKNQPQQQNKGRDEHMKPGSPNSNQR